MNNKQQVEITPQYEVSLPICTKPPTERDMRLTREVCQQTILHFKKKN